MASASYGGLRWPPLSHPISLSLLLGTFTLLISLLIAGVWWATYSEIALRHQEDTQRQLSAVFPQALHDNSLVDSEITLNLEGREQQVYRATLQGRPSGVVMFGAERGYSGVISLLIGINADGELTGVRTISHTETPGLGDKIELRHGDWILGFTGKSLQNTTEKQWHVKKDGGEFDAFTGATITPRAVVKSVYQTLLLFQRHREELLGLTEETSNE
ncbi:electron transport complex subunit RsxG [Brenneria goodwinii]|uniref:Ion-translocating oxidoreductase complex subunit G n=1 Tax=Brenneria goodwinii TaxID=1109412 RepID=A0A0G4K0H3_9GAMM|nr:electron transport complex subunit RsxG [Brenneria goodwinii]MCG8156656.1 electron transport complex subunit RsxG [Brenneria goodwinii]MCG8159724.1 electron transport complex subunit RsxG [Brenneria goodwinii]MCG8165814.1 electron transport complex subunit RsxG [Brenneria goodwinii]MCG8170225.1 electron transport complex subunit RsxG [Brenneria goodwinii]MCG8173583.1 electron transport complex subunit RsxG [Brenneria goodwinii]